MRRQNSGQVTMRSLFADLLESGVFTDQIIFIC